MLLALCPNTDSHPEADLPAEKCLTEQPGALYPDRDRPNLLQQAEPATHSILCSSAKGCQRRQTAVTKPSGVRIPDHDGGHSRETWERRQIKLGTT
jgi:hypothetical protein